VIGPKALAGTILFVLSVVVVAGLLLLAETIDWLLGD